MKTYENDKNYDLIIAVMDGREKAEEFFTVAKSKEADGAFQVKEAATFHRSESGQILLNNKGYVAGWKGGGIAARNVASFATRSTPSSAPSSPRSRSCSTIRSTGTWSATSETPSALS
jgi:hypothetical protein